MQNIPSVTEYNRSNDFYFDVPDGYSVDKISIENLTTSQAILDIGTTSTTDDIASGMIIDGTATNKGLVDHRFDFPRKTYKYSKWTRFQPRGTTRFYVNNNAVGSAWNGARIIFRVHISPFQDSLLNVHSK